MRGCIRDHLDLGRPEEVETEPTRPWGDDLHHVGEVLVAEYQSEVIEDSPSYVTVVLRFPSKDGRGGWLGAEGGGEVVGHRPPRQR